MNLTFFIDGAIFVYRILFSKVNIDHLAISYDNKLFVPVDVPGDGDCLYRALVDSDLIRISDPNTFRSNLSHRTNTLLKNGSSHGLHIRNYFNNNEKSIERG